MTVKRVLVLVGAALLVAGVIGLLVPVSVSDDNGGSITCGNAVAADLSAARSANNKNLANVPIVSQLVPHTDYVAKCQSSLASRRGWTIPLTIIGAIVVAGALFVRWPRKAASGDL
jgi:high-affinity K+ transport system ATPase subunit B